MPAPPLVLPLSPASADLLSESRKPCVCVVDADPAFCVFVRRVLGETCDVVACAHGEIALPALRERPADLVLASIEAARAGGRAWLKRLRAEARTRAVAVVLVGAGAEGEEPVDLQDELSDDYLKKPVTPLELTARVRTQLSLARERREAEARVRESEERFRHVAEHSPLMFWLSEADGCCTYLNERWYEFTGQSHAEALGRGWLDAIHPADIDAVRHELEEIARNQEGGRLGYRLRRHDGVYRWMLDTVTPRFLQGRFAGCVGSVIDITDEREEREVLARSRRHLEMALQAGRIGTFEWDIPTGQVLCSPELEILYGLAPGAFEKTYRAWLQRIVPEDAAGFEAMVRACFEQRTEEVGYEFRILMPDGTRRWFEGKWRCTFSANGRPRRMAGIQMDIDDRKRAELNSRFLNILNEATALISDPDAILNAAAVALGTHLQADECGFFSMNESGTPARAEHRWKQDWLTGGAGTAAVNWTAAELVRADAYHVAHMNDARASGEEANEGARAWAIAPFSRDGRWIAALRVVCSQPRVWHATELGLIEMVLARVWPLVERARSEQAFFAAEAKIHESEERLRATIEAAQLGTWSIYPGDERMIWDARCRELLGICEGVPPTFATFLGAVHLEDRERVRHAVQLAMLPAGGGAYDQEYRVEVAGASRWLRASGRVFFDSGKPVRFLGTLFDITDLVKARETLSERRAELERLVDERTGRLQDTIAELESFSYSISHDLRAPLRAMMSFGELLVDECGASVGPQGQDYLRRIIAASRRMDRLIQDVLVYSRVSRMELTLVPVDVQALVDGIVESYPQFHPENADILIPERLPVVIGHEAALMQCLANLLGNAVKFVAPGVRPRVEITAEKVGSRVKLSVQDNGIGIAAGAHAKIFGIFERFHTGYEGTGIGLAVVRRAAERMGGGVSVTSQPGAGSRFCLDLALVS